MFSSLVISAKLIPSAAIWKIIFTTLADPDQFPTFHLCPFYNHIWHLPEALFRFSFWSALRMRFFSTNPGYTCYKPDSSKLHSYRRHSRAGFTVITVINGNKPDLKKRGKYIQYKIPLPDSPCQTWKKSFTTTQPICLLFISSCSC